MPACAQPHLAPWPDLIAVGQTTYAVDVRRAYTETDATQTAGSTDTPTTSDTPTTGGATQGMVPESVCQQACEHLFACPSELAPSVEACVSSCIDTAYKDTATCISGAAGWWSCLGEAACEDVAGQSVKGCELPYANYLISCGDCHAEVSSNAPGLCTASAECPDAVAVAFVCNGDSCTCQLNEGEVYATCPALDVCSSEPDEVRSAAAACCGVPFVDLAP